MKAELAKATCPNKGEEKEVAHILAMTWRFWEGSSPGPYALAVALDLVSSLASGTPEQ